MANPSPVKMVQAVVARNRTVHDQTKPDEPPTLYKAGAKVRLSESEVIRLRALGFLEPETTDESDEGGVQITGAASSVKITGR